MFATGEGLMPTDRHRWLEDRAYFIWQYDGCPDGRTLQHWLQAEEELCEAERAAHLATTAAG